LPFTVTVAPAAAAIGLIVLAMAEMVLVTYTSPSRLLAGRA
jgi:hypothetical protein